jgi:tRNA(Leu) C34 or U34 (ribose-2'-O)-methylase TrmL
MSVTLVGDGIENPANGVTMIHAARMFEAGCRFRDTKGIVQSIAPLESVETITSSEVRARHARVIACDNLPKAKEVYGFGAGKDFALIVGNERRGLSHEFAEIATDCVEIPMQSRQINCLNVAAASAVALYYLTGKPSGPMVERRDPASRRPELLLYEPEDHFELGSTIRSAAAFGWTRSFIEDTKQIWFGCNREVRSEGRAAARRGKNDIFLIPYSTARSHVYERVTVASSRCDGVPLYRANLSIGPRQLIVIPDEIGGERRNEDWERLGKEVEFVSVPVPNRNFTYHYRLMASIVLAEVSRQVGRRTIIKGLPPRRPPAYEMELAMEEQKVGESVSFAELMNY